MWPSSRRRLLGSALVLCIGGLGLGLGSAGAAPSKEPPLVAPRPKRPTREALLKGFDPRRHQLEDGRYTSRLDKGYKAVLTLDAGLQEFVRGVLRRYQVPVAGFVAVEPSTGKLLAYVSHSTDAADERDHVRDPSPPAASVFKVVTGAALLDAGLKPSTTTCYHGGASRLTMAELVDNKALDTACISLSGALGFSVNAVFGKLALKHLDDARLTRYASAFGFGERLPFDAVTQPSALDVPKERLEFARAAAGFWHMHLSPLHGAMLAATVANRGRMMKPYVVERILSPNGNLLARTEPALHRTVLERRTAELLGQMMRTTVTQGTARKTFYDERGQPFLPGIDVAGKTGTLSQERPYRGYTWWVGYAPVQSPQIAVAALIVNTPKWRIKASYLAREALRYHLIEAPKKGATAQVARE
jgi:peptidoglycan glycosyltransferase